MLRGVGGGYIEEGSTEGWAQFGKSPAVLRPRQGLEAGFGMMLSRARKRRQCGGAMQIIGECSSNTGRWLFAYLSIVKAVVRA